MMKKPWMAFLLNFLLPGAGMGYLHRWGLALANFLLVQLILLVLCFWPPGPEWHEHFHYVLLVLMAASGGWAHAVASQRRGVAWRTDRRHDGGSSKDKPLQGRARMESNYRIDDVGGPEAWNKPNR